MLFLRLQRLLQPHQQQPLKRALQLRKSVPHVCRKRLLVQMFPILLLLLRLISALMAAVVSVLLLLLLLLLLPRARTMLHSIRHLLRDVTQPMAIRLYKALRWAQHPVGAISCGRLRWRLGDTQQWMGCQTAPWRRTR
jgi:hypothetical protein